MSKAPSKTVSRREASILTGLSPNTLKKMGVEGRGPAFIKLGPKQQSRTLYRIDEVEKWKRDPVGYERRRQGPKYDRP